MNHIRNTVTVAAMLAALVAVTAICSAEAATYVPLNGEDTASATVDGASGTTIHLVGGGVGYASHLGRYRVMDESTLDLVSLSFVGSYTLIAANGDTVRGTFAGHALPDLSGYITSGPIVGGTGRFAGATGQLSWRGIVDFASLTSTDAFTGTISSVGSS